MARSAARMTSSATVWSVGRYSASPAAKTRLPQGVDEPVGGERLAPRRTDRHPVAQRQGLRPEAVHAGSVAGRVDREHLAASCPHRATGGAELAPVGTRTRRPGRTHGVACGGEGFGDGVGTRAGRGHRQAGHPAGERRRNCRSRVRRSSTTRRRRRPWSARPHVPRRAGVAACAARRSTCARIALARRMIPRPARQRCP